MISAHHDTATLHLAARIIRARADRLQIGGAEARIGLRDLACELDEAARLQSKDRFGIVHRTAEGREVRL